METDIFLQALLNLDRETARAQMLLAMREANRATAVEKILLPTMQRIGLMWEKGEAALSQVYMSGRICEDLLDEMLPAAAGSQGLFPPAAILVFEDNHALGKRLVFSALRLAQIPVRDYGIGVTLEELIDNVRQERPRVLLISVLMLRSALRVGALIRQLESLAERPYVIVGGAPFLLDRQLWRQVGADAMAANSAEVIRLLDEIGIKSLRDSKEWVK